MAITITYCPSCGDPGAGKWEGLVDEITEGVAKRMPVNRPDGLADLESTVYEVLALLCEDDSVARAIEQIKVRP